jgi:hypothetical protein
LEKKSFRALYENDFLVRSFLAKEQFSLNILNFGRFGGRANSGSCSVPDLTGEQNRRGGIPRWGIIVRGGGGQRGKHPCIPTDCAMEK